MVKNGIYSRRTILLAVMVVVVVIIGLGLLKDYIGMGSDRVVDSSRLLDIDCLEKFNTYYTKYIGIYEELYEKDTVTIKSIIDNVSSTLNTLEKDEATSRNMYASSLVNEAKMLVEKSKEYLEKGDHVKAYVSGRVSMVLLETARKYIDYTGRDLNSAIMSVENNIKDVKLMINKLEERVLKRYSYIDVKRVPLSWVIIEASLERRLWDAARELENYVSLLSELKNGLSSNSRNPKQLLAQVSGGLFGLELRLNDLEGYLDKARSLTLSPDVYVDLEGLYNNMVGRIAELNNTIKPVLKGDIGRFYNESQSTIQYSKNMYEKGYKALALISCIRGYVMLGAVKELLDDPIAVLVQSSPRVSLDKVLYAKKLVLDALEPKGNVPGEYSTLFYIVVKPFIQDTRVADELVKRALEYNTVEGEEITVDAFAYLLYMRTYHVLVLTRNVLGEVLRVS